MKIKNILIISLFFLLILTLGAVNASDDIPSNGLSVSLVDGDVQESSIDDLGLIEEKTVISDDSCDEILDAEENVPIQKMQDETEVANQDEMEDSNQVIQAKSDDVITQEEPVDPVSSSKVNSVISPVSNLVANGKYFYIYLKDELGNRLANQKVSFAVNGKTYSAVSNAQGKAWFKVNLALGTYPLKITYNGDENHSAVTKSLNLYVPRASAISIGNAKLLTNGYLRIYLRCENQSLIGNKVLQITVNGKQFNKTTNKEGIMIFKPKAGTGVINISAVFNGNSKIAPSLAKKTIKGVVGDIKSPYKNKIPLVNGRPDVDVLGGNYHLP